MLEPKAESFSGFPSKKRGNYISWAKDGAAGGWAVAKFQV